jgi:type IV secretion system protein VirB11
MHPRSFIHYFVFSRRLIAKMSIDTSSNVLLANTNKVNTANKQQLAHDEILQRNTDKLRSELGTTICEALDNPEVIEIMVNPDGRIWIDRLSHGMSDTKKRIAHDRLIAALGTIAAMLKTEVNKFSPILEGELPLDGSRVEGVLSPVTKATTLVIRKHSSAVFPIERYVEENRIDEKSWGFLKDAITGRRNILIVGGTGSGKTTFVNAILDALARFCPNDRVVILEDTVELQCNMENVLAMRTDSQSNTTMQRLVKVSFRVRPDRIIVGEVRSGEALDLLKSWNTGHPGGICTIHANSAVSALTRMEQLISEVSRTPMKELIGEAIDVVVFLRRIAKFGPFVTEILEVKGMNAIGNYDYEYVYNATESGKIFLSLE